MPEARVVLPTLHAGQVDLFNSLTRFTGARCGRRFGKTTFGEVLACDTALKGWPVGWFAPEYRFLSEPYVDIKRMLEPVESSSNKSDGTIRLQTGGGIDFWTLDNDKAGRGRKYKLVVIDEGAFTKPTMLHMWRTAIRPTLLDLRGRCVVLSNTNGSNEENFLYQVCKEPQHGFTDYHAPTSANPHLPADEIALLKEQNHPLVYAQEYLAEFVDWSGVQFFSKEALLVGGQPVEFPRRCDAVFATVDTAMKSGKKHDGTAVVYWAIDAGPGGHRLTILDYDVMKIDGALLAQWLPSVEMRLEQLSAECGAREGSLGVKIEDKSSGTILLQQAAIDDMDAEAIDGGLTAMGKDERALNASKYVFQGLVKFSRYAYDKIVQYGETTRNQLLAQITGYRVGVDGKQDDLLDCFTYGVALGLGNSEGF